VNFNSFRLDFNDASRAIRHWYVNRWFICLVGIGFVRQGHGDVELDDAADCSGEIIA
jgi:hypothetical protein